MLYIGREKEREREREGERERKKKKEPDGGNEAILMRYIKPKSRKITRRINVESWCSLQVVRIDLTE